MESVEAQITELLCNYMVAANLYNNFKIYRDSRSKIDPIIREGNVVYVVSFREGK